MRRAAGEGLVRFLLFCGTFGLLRWSTATHRTWTEEISSTFELSLGGWAGWIALVVAGGFVIGLACLPGRPARYRVHVPLVIALPALALLAHHALVIEAAQRGWERLPWILNNAFFYLDTGPQYALAVIAGFGIAMGLQPKAPVEEPAPQS